MPASFSLTLHFPLPASIPPHLVIQTLHAHEPLIRPNPYLQNFRRLPVDMDEVVADPFFSSSDPQDHIDNNNFIACYEIHDRIPVVGFLGIYKDTIFPAIFQNTPRGVRVKAEAAMGVKVRSVYEVCSRAVGDAGFDEGRTETTPHGGAGVGAGNGGRREWELVERSHVECGALLKPFVMKQFEAGHRDLCQKVLDGIAGARDKDLPPLPEEARWQ